MKKSIEGIEYRVSGSNLVRTFGQFSYIPPVHSAVKGYMNPKFGKVLIVGVKCIERNPSILNGLSMITFG